MTEQIVEGQSLPSELRLTVKGSDWIQTIEGIVVNEDGTLTCTNVRLEREKKQHFHITMVWDEALDREGKPFKFLHPHLFEHANARGIIGEVVLTIRRHPGGRLMTKMDFELHFWSETHFESMMRVDRSSIDNAERPATRNKSHLIFLGQLNSNSRRIGGPPINAYLRLGEWSPQQEDDMYDIAEFPEIYDAIGLAVMTKGFKKMGKELALEVVEQMYDLKHVLFLTPEATGK
jgi:hypothetical protein